jgi:hypothetical protein
MSVQLEEKEKSKEYVGLKHQEHLQHRNQIKRSEMESQFHM